jgi:hypothetical protein
VALYHYGVFEQYNVQVLSAVQNIIDTEDREIFKEAGADWRSVPAAWPDDAGGRPGRRRNHRLPHHRADPRLRWRAGQQLRQ